MSRLELASTSTSLHCAHHACAIINVQAPGTMSTQLALEPNVPRFKDASIQAEQQHCPSTHKLAGHEAPNLPAFFPCVALSSASADAESCL
jgi:hypothetical protein